MWFDTLILQLRLHMAYRVNGILYRLRFLRLPYENSFAKTLGLVLAVLREIFGILLGKLLYMAVFFAAPLLLIRRELPPELYGHLLVFLTLIGGIFNNNLLNGGRDAYYAVILLRMDARRYTLSAYGYYLLKTAVGFLAAALLVGHLILRQGLALCLLTPVLVCGVKLLSAGLELRHFHRRGILPRDEKRFSLLQGTSVLLLAAAYLPPLLLNRALPSAAVYAVCGLAAAYLPPLLLNRALPSAAVYAVCGLAAAGGAWGAVYLLHFSGYRRVYRHLFTADVSLLSGNDPQAAARETQAQYQSKLTLDAGPDSRKTGCARFNELFVRRNYRLLMRPARRTAVIAGAALAPGCAACLALPEIAAAINGALVPALPMMLLLMYFINRGNTVTQVLFFNCDSSMLSYRFYRQPRVILGIFTARLKSLTAINLLPTAVIALGLPLLLLCSGGTDTPTDYLVLPLAILAMSVFFSVHYLVLYYLLQPYTAGLENTSFGYRLITGLTYFVCYMIYANVHGATMAFGIGMIVFAAAYVAAALLLAYRLAPRTFKLRT